MPAFPSHTPDWMQGDRQPAYVPVMVDCTSDCDPNKSSTKLRCPTSCYSKERSDGHDQPLFPSKEDMDHVSHSVHDMGHTTHAGGMDTRERWGLGCTILLMSMGAKATSGTQPPDLSHRGLF